MQGDRSILDSFPETIDLNQGSVSNNASVDPTASWDSFLSPVENRLSNSMLSPAGRNPSYVNGVNYYAQSFSGWDQGESSSTANLHDCTRGSDLSIGQGWPSSSNDYVITNSRSERLFEPSSVFSTSGYGGNHPIGRPPSVSSNLASDHSPVNANLSGGYNNDDGRLVMRTSVPPLPYKSDRSEAERPPAFGASDHSGTSTGSSGYLARTSDISGSSMDKWGSSVKRKAIEGNSGHSFAGGSSSSNAGPENIVQHNYPSSYNASSSLNILSPAANIQNAGYLENTYPRNGLGTSMSASDIFPPLSAGRIAESSARNFGAANRVNQDLITPGLPPIGTTVGHSSVSPAHVPGPASSSLDLRQPFSLPMNSGNLGSQSHVMHAPGHSRGFHSLPWDLPPSSRGGSSSMISGDRGAALGDEANFSTIRNNREVHPFVPVPESRNMVLDPTNWSLATANASSSRNSPSSAVGPGSRAHNSPTAWANQNSATTSHHGLPEFAPWNLFPPVEPESGSQRGHFSLLPSAASSSEGPVMSSRSSSRGSRQPHLRSSLMVDPGDDVDGWRALAADVGGRHRLIRQVLNAMRRVENLRSEDLMLVDPFINGVAEFHDRHRDMRLDVDNMSYEELLALEERIGNVNTGLSEETISVNMKQRKHESVRRRSSSNLEPCSICQEEYTAGDIMGMLDCGHEFHTNCIKQWLVLKNTCPICKMTALET
ncbi:E3 ubiquitin-protein ligase MBR1-like [Lycium barbarum]|uniref:E3 ubiquitin-protein ligase MBR1-like n=1 Tax=Lycium barbarum TaxID=112863 RepID=UPI00293E1EE1|nr:E3 ubiquitin-protein ligase MBR1-like [Lycium barbarum]XP_060176028.1 E3 ubiquitin-protein ligase MBR1-like [Lycium barbarum]